MLFSMRKKRLGVFLFRKQSMRILMIVLLFETYQRLNIEEVLSHGGTEGLAMIVFLKDLIEYLLIKRWVVGSITLR